MNLFQYKKGQRKNLSKKYLWSFFGVVLSIDLLITLVLFTLYASIQTTKAIEHYSTQLEQVGLMTDLLYDSMDSFSKQIIQDKDTYGCLLNPSFDRLQEARACRKLRSIQTSNPYIRYVSFYNSESERFLSSSYAGYLTNSEIEILYNQVSSAQDACFVRRIGANYYTQTEKRATVYTFVFKLKIRPNSTNDLIIIDVNEEYFNSVFHALRNSSELEQSVLMISPDYQIITTQTAEKGSNIFEQKLYDTSFAPSDLSKKNEQSGSFTYTPKGGYLSLVTYTQATQSGVFLVNIVPYASVLKGLIEIGLLTLTLSILTLGFGYIISKRMSRVLYAPIQTLYSNYVTTAGKANSETEFDQLSKAFSDMYAKAIRLEQGLISTYNDSRRLYLDYILNGMIENQRDIGAICERLSIDISSSHYTVIIISCSEINSTDNSTSQDVFINYYALNNMAKEILSVHGNTEILRTQESTFTVLLSLSTNSLPQDICRDLETINQVMLKEFGIEATICIGKIVEGFENINICYEATKIAMNTSSYKYHGRTFIAENKTEAFTADQYYNKLHLQFSEYVRNGNLELCSSEFDRAISSMENVSFTTAKRFFNHVMMTLLDDFSIFLEKDDKSFPALAKNTENIFSANNVSEVKKIVMDFLSELIHNLALNKKGSNQGLIEKAQSYIDQNYNNPDLNIGQLAEMAELSPAYFGKIFSSVTTFSFNDYLSNKRMSAAVDMLENTKLTINEISEKVGFLNSNYFYSVFKKKYGITPSQYRKNLNK